MRLAVLYDARVHLPAFHALKAWRLAVMASSTSLFHHLSKPILLSGGLRGFNKKKKNIVLFQYTEAPRVNSF